MPSSRGAVPLCFRRIGRPEFGLLESLEFEPEQAERFIGPIPDVLDAVRRGLAHSMMGIEADGALIGFYVIHPDARDRACWWLGWFAIDRRRQGRGYGHAAMLAIMGRLQRIEGCRRVRLLVAPDNRHAIRLYAQARFRHVGVWAGTGELIMECVLAGKLPSGRGAVAALIAASLVPRCVDRIQAVDAPLWARAWGGAHGPPQAGAACVRT